MRMFRFFSPVFLGATVVSMLSCGLFSGKSDICKFSCELMPDCFAEALGEIDCDVDEDDFDEAKEDCFDDCEEAYADLKGDEQSGINECGKCLVDEFPKSCEDEDDIYKADDIWSDDCEDECEDNNDAEDAWDDMDFDAFESFDKVLEDALEDCDEYSNGSGTYSY